MLGDNCEPGVVQRCFGAEPLDLLRFAGGSIANVIDVVETDGRYLFVDDDIAMEISGEGEYLIRSKHYNDFPCHTHLYERDVERDAFLRKRQPVVAYLKTRFFSELRDGDKIYVRAGPEDIGELRRLRRALSRHKPRILLNVSQADAFHPPGTIERLGPGLWRGYIATFKNFQTADPFDLASWQTVLSATSSKEGRPRCAPNRLLTTRASWVLAAEHAVAAGRAGDSVGDTALVTKDWSADDRLLACLDIPLALPGETLIVFAVRVWLDGSYNGHPLHLSLENATALHQVVGDPARRDCWQHPFVTAKIAPRQTCVTLGVRAVASPGSRVVLGAATVETGVVPGSLLARRSSRAGVVRGIKRQLAIARGRFPRRPPRDIAAAAENAIAAGAFIEADDLLAAALRARPDDVVLTKLYATSAHNSARHVAAIQRWQRLLDLVPSDPMSFAGLACSFREYKVLDRAQGVIAAGLENFPDDLVMLTEAARIAFAQKRFGEAVRLYDRAIALHGAHEKWIEARDKAETELNAAAPT